MDKKAVCVLFLLCFSNLCFSDTLYMSKLSPERVGHFPSTETRLSKLAEDTKGLRKWGDATAILGVATIFSGYYILSRQDMDIDERNAGILVSTYGLSLFLKGAHLQNRVIRTRAKHHVVMSADEQKREYIASEVLGELADKERKWRVAHGITDATIATLFLIFRPLREEEIWPPWSDAVIVLKHPTFENYLTVTSFLGLAARSFLFKSKEEKAFAGYLQDKELGKVSLHLAQTNNLMTLVCRF